LTGSEGDMLRVFKGPALAAGFGAVEDEGTGFLTEATGFAGGFGSDLAGYHQRDDAHIPWLWGQIEQVALSLAESSGLRTRGH
jgi:hypothetical protein